MNGFCRYHRPLRDVDVLDACIGFGMRLRFRQGEFMRSFRAFLIEEAEGKTKSGLVDVEE